MKMRVTPFWKSTRNPQNWHTVTYIFSSLRDPNLNPLLMAEGFEQLIDSYCSGCKAGLRTAGSCLHRIAGIILLCGAQCFDTAKVQEPVYLDTARSCCFFTYYFNPFLDQIHKYHCTVVHLQPTLVGNVKSCTVFHSDHHMPFLIVGVTHLESFSLGMKMVLMELPCLLGMIKTSLMRPYQQQIFPTSTSVNCLDKVLGIGSVVIATSNKITSEVKGLLF